MRELASEELREVNAGATGNLIPYIAAVGFVGAYGAFMYEFFSNPSPDLLFPGLVLMVFSFYLGTYFLNT